MRMKTTFMSCFHQRKSGVLFALTVLCDKTLSHNTYDNGLTLETLFPRLSLFLAGVQRREDCYVQSAFKTLSKKFICREQKQNWVIFVVNKFLC